MLSVVQFSDLHVTSPGVRTYQGAGPDGGQAWETAIQQVFAADLPLPDRVVVTGDIADSGTVAEYRVAAGRLSQLQVPANVITGGHDFRIPAEATIPTGTVSMNRAERHGPWMFLYVDSNATGARGGDRNGKSSDQIPGNGGLTAGELRWIEQIIDVSDAEHIWLWMYNTPNAPARFTNPDFTDAVASIIRRHQRVRGVGSGHLHHSATIELAGVPIYACPSLTLNWTVDTWETLPPGYREYTFSDDGTVASRAVDVDLPGFKSHKLAKSVIEYLKNELSWRDVESGLDA